MKCPHSHASLQGNNDIDLGHFSQSKRQERYKQLQMYSIDSFAE